MRSPTPGRTRPPHRYASLLAIAAVGLAAGLVGPAPADANADGTGLVISEVYGGGGIPGAPFNADFVELFNPTGVPISLTGLSVHFRSATGSFVSPPFALTGSLPSQRHYLIRMSGIRSNGAPLPTPDAVASPTIGVASRGGQVFVLKGTKPVPSSGDMVGNAKVIDMVGLGGGAQSFETAPGPNTSVTLSANRRLDSEDTDDNSADFGLAAPSPTPTEQADNLAVVAAVLPGSVKVRSGRANVDVRLLTTGPAPTAGIELFADGALVSTLIASNGEASATLGPFRRPGSVTLVARYVGDLTYPATPSASLPLRVTKARPGMTVTKSPQPVRSRTTGPRVGVRLSAEGFTVRGKVRWRAAGRTWTRFLQDGKASLRLPAYASPGRKRVKVVYLGSRLASRVSRTVTIKVVR